MAFENNVLIYNFTHIYVKIHNDTTCTNTHTFMHACIQKHVHIYFCIISYPWLGTGIK